MSKFISAVSFLVALLGCATADTFPNLRKLQDRPGVIRQTLERAIRLGNFRVIFSRFNVQRDPFEYVCCDKCEERFSDVSEAAITACNEKCRRDCKPAVEECNEFDNRQKVMLIQTACAGTKFICGIGGVAVPSPIGTCTQNTQENCMNFANNNVDLCLRSITDANYGSCDEARFKQEYDWVAQWPCKFFARE
uniref:Uncharacterized protein n=1 Tax=Chromera velia CCMP2878 TaxID=1169474 RepID=A0A0G4F7F3_9ALVE|eukprot:Cvel_15420.t1-p1 / transcript=Cvel_15420.t1 / gene=Cvel_15420 / organism=Chromera_velia_CCMP2878 / gene_product=hypothetical protein / transcript_product=hypothetical protein / location=Cvel_scaffold1139:43516-44091(-) / protein_length=192 / sequence_SO=supercontig / SO=protein_coding / is_pseudo=false